MSFLFGDFITQLNKDTREYFTSISSDYFHNITIDGTDIVCIDYCKYYCALLLKKKKFFRGYTIDHRSFNNTLKNPVIRRHDIQKKNEKNHH